MRHRTSGTQSLATYLLVALLALATAACVASDPDPKGEPSDDNDDVVIVIDPTDAGGSSDANVDAADEDGGADDGRDAGDTGCADGLVECAGDCVDTRTNADHCGACQTQCGDSEFCEAGSCEAQVTDCRTEPCGGFTYCDTDSGKCEPGCDENADCGDNERCLDSTHECVCEAGYHDCGGACVPDDDVATCGDRCSPCPGASNGSATCDGSVCGLSCDAGYKLCGGSCAACPSVPSGVGSVGCDANACVADCDEGFIACPSGCCPQNVDVVGNGGGVRLAVDASGTFHLGYRRSDRLVHAEYDGQAWQEDTVYVPNASSVDEYHVRGTGKYMFTVDDGGEPHFIFDAEDWELRYATPDGADWTTEVLTMPNDARIRAGMLTYGGGTLHAAVTDHYYFDYDKRLAYMKYSAQHGWVVSYLSYENETVNPKDIAVDPSGEPHILAWHIDNDEVMVGSESTTGSYTSWGPGWGFETIIAGAALRKIHEIEFDDAGDLHFGFTVENSSGDHEVRYGVRSGGSWSFETVHTDSYIADGDFTLGPQGNPYFVIDGISGLYVASRENGTWSVDSIQGYVDSGGGPWDVSLGFDSGGNPNLFSSTSGGEVTHGY